MLIINDMNRIRLKDKTFERVIPYERISDNIDALAARLNGDYADRETPLFLGVLNGSFMFMAELMRRIDFTCEMSFVKLASYHGTKSSGTMTELIGLADNLRGRHIIVVEDIVETGDTIEYLLRTLAGHEPASVEIATLLFKPESYKKEKPIKYSALPIPNDFIVGFGLDYDGLGRNLKDIYKIADE